MWILAILDLFPVKSYEYTSKTSLNCLNSLLRVIPYFNYSLFYLVINKLCVNRQVQTASSSFTINRGGISLAEHLRSEPKQTHKYLALSSEINGHPKILTHNQIVKLSSRFISMK
jgi:hypothetical protein